MLSKNTNSSLFEHTKKEHTSKYQMIQQVNETKGNAQILRSLELNQVGIIRNQKYHRRFIISVNAVRIVHSNGKQLAAQLELSIQLFLFIVTSAGLMKNPLDTLNYRISAIAIDGYYQYYIHSELCIVCANDIFGILNVNNVFRPINENESAKPVMQIMKLLKLAGDALFDVVSEAKHLHS